MAEIVPGKNRSRPSAHELDHVHRKLGYTPLAGYRVFLVQAIEHDGQNAQKNVRKERYRVVCPPHQVARQENGRSDQGPEERRAGRGENAVGRFFHRDIDAFDRGIRKAPFPRRIGCNVVQHDIADLGSPDCARLDRADVDEVIVAARGRTHEPKAFVIIPKNEDAFLQAGIVSDDRLLTGGHLLFVGGGRSQFNLP